MIGFIIGAIVATIINWALFAYLVQDIDSEGL